MSEGAPLPRPVRFDCPMCTRVQKLRLSETRCESCGARLRIFGDAAEARRALEADSARSRLLRPLADGLFLVATL
jgi:hypothetical protein